MIREITCDRAIDHEGQPDGGDVPVIDAYDGCQLCCPYCFQWDDAGWNRDILVKTNLPEALDRELAAWDPAQKLYVGSRGDPYMPLEAQYGLTRSVLQALLARGVPCILSTKSASPAFYRDVDLFQAYGDRLTVCVGQADLAHLRPNVDPRTLPNIRAANELTRRGIRTWAFITPVLPGITDVDAMVGALPQTMPVYLDRVRIGAGSRVEARFSAFLRAHYPELEHRYRALVENGTDPYYEQLRRAYHDDPRVKFVFGEQ